jgi:hypothetical protein
MSILYVDYMKILINQFVINFCPFNKLMLTLE